ncbi:outer membrane protein assembly factor BamB family protein [Jatrophihabitans sp.]|uniref:outer membrane protein assembly factor BamB family protein n=1 Tax=Jatrophihabitans sp. TaxID=1932789 RepID=UPI003F7DF79C
MRCTRLLPLLAAAASSLLVLSACSSDTPVGLQRASGPISAGLPGVGTLPPPASAWPEAGHDARYSSATTAVGPATAHVRWTKRLGGPITPGPVIGIDGSVLVAVDTGTLSALDPRDGSVRWSYAAGGSYGTGDLSTSPAVLADGEILWPGPHDTLYALSASGRLLWTQRFDGQVLSPAIGGAHRVYVADMAGQLSALEVLPNSHRLVWTVSFGGTDFSSPSIAPDGTVYTGSDNDLIAVRDLGPHGSVVWRFHTAKQVEVSNPVAPDGTVVLGTNNADEYGIRADGMVAWRLPIGDNTYSSAIARSDGLAYYGDNSARLRVVDTTTGRLVHLLQPHTRSHDSIWSEPIVDAHGSIYWATTGGNVYGVTASGQPMWQAQVDGAVDDYPALGADGTLYIGTSNGTLTAFG